MPYLQDAVKEGNIVCPLFKGGLEERKCLFDAGSVATKRFIFNWGLLYIICQYGYLASIECVVPYRLQAGCAIVEGRESLALSFRGIPTRLQSPDQAPYLQTGRLMRKARILGAQNVSCTVARCCRRRSSSVSL